MKIVLFGASDITPMIADFLVGNGYDLCAIVTTPSQFKISYNPNGVKNLRHADMHDWAEGKGIPVFDYTDGSKALADLSSLKPDFALVAGWYHMVPKKLRDLFTVGCAGFHASLLPLLRGGAPLNWAILLGHKEAGVSFFELSDGVDDGLLYAQKKFSILDNDAIGDLVAKSRDAMLAMLAETLPGIRDGSVKPYAQQGEPTYAAQRVPEDSLINWQDSAVDILRLIRASSKPYGGAFTFLDDEKVVIWSAMQTSTPIHGAPGQIMIVDGHACIICGDGAIAVTDYESSLSLEKSGQKRLSIKNKAA